MPEELPDYILNACYKCERCGNSWTKKSGSTFCEKCGGVRVIWLNHPNILAQEKK
jgi:DNA-directed RNA polymerase subunit RPC12/RpoP